MNGARPCLAAVVVLFLARAAAAQPSEADRTAAVALFDQAQKLMDAGDYAAACPKLAESSRLDLQIGALLHLADCYENAGRLASAWASWRDAADVAQKRGDTREQAARDRATALEPRLSKLKIRVAESEVTGLEIRKDGSALPRSLWGTELPVDVGEHLVEATAPGKKAFSAKVAVSREGATEVFDVGALADEPATATPPTPVPTPPVAPVPQSAPQPAPAESRGGTQRTVGWIAGGLGLVGLGVGVYFDLQRRSKDGDRADICPSGTGCTRDDKDRVDALNHDVKTAGISEYVAFGAGGLLLVGGATLLLTAPSGSDARPEQARFVVVPGIARGSMGLSAAGRW